MPRSQEPGSEKLGTTKGKMIAIDFGYLDNNAQKYATKFSMAP